MMPCFRASQPWRQLADPSGGAPAGPLDQETAARCGRLLRGQPGRSRSHTGSVLPLVTRESDPRPHGLLCGRLQEDGAAWGTTATVACERSRTAIAIEPLSHLSSESTG